ncbi:hypothetical protein HK096_000422 [Nowakowskiella sp. JEL0078]|nr:hypothetical protein HK096_000422 [Nowakowskiella sp. JEL0078]
MGDNDSFNLFQKILVKSNKAYLIQDPTFRKTLFVLSTLVLLNIAIWVVSIIVFQPWISSFLPILILAYTLGLRHAFDADHIAAIDNVTRKLVAEGDKPVLVGFWFATGHSTVVIDTE